MPFPNEEIKNAYENSLSIVEGCFKEEPDLLELGGLIQQLYEGIKNRVDEDTLRDLNGLMQLTQEVQEYQSRHGFTEGWLMARGERTVSK